MRLHNYILNKDLFFDIGNFHKNFLDLRGNENYNYKSG